MSDRLPEFNEGQNFDEGQAPAHPPFPALSWLAVFLVLAVLLNPGWFFPAAPAGAKPAPEPLEEPLAGEAMMVKLVWGMQIVSGAPGDTVLPKLEAIEKKGPTENLALTVVEAVAAGPVPAAIRLAKLTEKVKGTALEKSYFIVRDWIEKLAKDPRADIAPADREELAKHLGWFAGIPGQSREKLKEDRFWEKDPQGFLGKMVVGALKIAALSLLVLALLVVGLILLVVFGLVSMKGPLGPGLLMNEDGPTASTVLMQTFAIWFVGYFALSLIFGAFIVPATGMSQLVASAFIQVTSMAALVWPFLRGMTFRTLAEQLGLAKHPGSPREILVGITGTVAFWPILFFLAFLSAVLAQATPGAEPPSHPLTKQLLGGAKTDWFLGFLTACVLAPIVEEVFFRGCLYRHLRETAQGAGPGLALALSVGISSVIFAVIHPQGILGLPVLGGLGAFFALLREWRDNLTASIAAHAMVNTTTLMLLSFL